MPVDETVPTDAERTVPLSARVAVVVPCRDEALTIAEVVTSFREVAPTAEIVVADNGSTDGTAAAAAAAGARVVYEPRAGKGRAIRRLFADVDADCYVMVDGDATYDPSTLPQMVAEVFEHNTDMVVAKRVGQDGAFRAGHSHGNRILSWTFRRLFRISLDDTLSGYRALSRRFVKTFPILSAGFEVETDLNAHAASLGLSYREIDSAYKSRPVGSESKLSTWTDGVRILRRLLRLFRDWRPMLTFSLLGLAMIAVSAAVAAPVVIDFVDTGLVERMPTLLVAAATSIIGFGLIAVGIVLERIAQVRLEVTRLLYLSLRANRS